MRFAKVEWILQDKCFGAEQADLIRAILEYDCCEVIIGIPDSIDHHNYRVIRGSTEFVHSYNNIFGEYDPFCITACFDHYKCSNYYSNIHCDDLLNSYCFWMPWKYLSEDVFDFFNSDRVFIRPDSGYKIFTGTTVGKKWFTKELEVIQGLPSSKLLRPDTMVLVSDYKEITKEARFLMGPNGMIAGSWYSHCGNSLELKEMSKFAQKAGNFYDEFFTVDVAQTKKYGLQIVEVNSFSSAGLYDMHAPTVVKNIINHIKAFSD